MDFATPDFVLNAIRDRLEHPVVGYTDEPEELIAAVVDWGKRRFDWNIHPDWLVFYTSLVPGLNVAVRSVGNDGDPTLIFNPIYPPFLKLAEINHREMLTSALLDTGRQWVIDYDNLDELTSQHQNLSALICNPQNPTGRVYTESELTQFATICLRNHTVMVCDEIHWGLILDEDAEHIPLASIDEEIANQTITLTSHTKSYNLAGLQCALAIIPNETLRDQFVAAKSGWTSAVSPLAYAAATAAFNDRTNWLNELQSYLRVNRDLIQDRLGNLNNLAMRHVEGTHLGWIDARQLNVEHPAAYFEAHGLGFSDGVEFGAEGYVRFNFATPRSLIERALTRLETASECSPLKSNL